MTAISDYTTDNRDLRETWLGLTVSVDPVGLFKNALENCTADELLVVVDNLVYYVDQTLAGDGKFSVQGFIRSLQKEEGL